MTADQLPHREAVTDTSTIATQVRAWRIRRGLTQQQFADALGRHVTWVKKFEAAERQVDPRISLLIEVARVLDVPLDALLVEPRASASERLEKVEIAELRAALLRPVAAGPSRQGDIARLARQVAYGFDAYQAGRYADLGRLLPGLIGEARARSDGSSVPDAVLRLLSDTMHLTANVFMKFGDPLSAWHAADRAQAAAETLDDPVAIALAAQTLAYAATGIGQGRAGVDILRSAIDKLEPRLAICGEEGWTALGMMQLKASVAAASDGDASTTRDMIDVARVSASRVAVDANVRKTGFNVTNVLLYEASVLGQLGDHDRAVQRAGTITPTALAGLPRERRTHYLIETAASTLATGEADRTLVLLLAAERDSPTGLAYAPDARDVINGLVQARRGPHDGAGLRGLAKRAGVAG